MAQVDTNRSHGLFLHEQLAQLHPENTQKFSNIASDEDIMENNYMFVMLSDLSGMSHLIFPKCFFFISGAKSKDNLTHYETTNFSLFQNFKFDENGSKLSKRIENIVGKGEIACTSSFSFSHSVFKGLVS